MYRAPCVPKFSIDVFAVICIKQINYHAHMQIFILFSCFVFLFLLFVFHLPATHFLLHSIEGSVFSFFLSGASRLPPPFSTSFYFSLSLCYSSFTPSYFYPALSHIFFSVLFHHIFLANYSTHRHAFCLAFSSLYA